MLQRFIPTSVEKQLMAVLALSFSALLALLAILEVLEYDDVVEWARSDYSTARLTRIAPLLPRLREGELDGYIKGVSRCHEGYTLTAQPHPINRQSKATQEIEARIADTLSFQRTNIRAGFVTLTENDFSYDECQAGEIDFPIEGIVISVRTADNQWLNAEVHPHEWHFTPTITGWLVRSGTAFFLVGMIALIFVRRIGKPLNALANAARTFGKGLRVEEVDEAGPPDVKRAIQSFNAMQLQVADAVKKRTTTLAAISHDVRSPLTALRLKAELVDHEPIRSDLLASVSKMERITKSALEYLRGESLSEEKKRIDLGSLVESECHDFIESGAQVTFSSKEVILVNCRPDAMSRAVRNLIENAVKYAGHADVSVHQEKSRAFIFVRDRGPGIPDDARALALEPFERLSIARESENGGFGLGLAIVKAIVEGHDGTLELTTNMPHGLAVTISLPSLLL